MALNIACKLEPTLPKVFKSVLASKLTLIQMGGGQGDCPVSLVASLLKLSGLLFL